MVSTLEHTSIHTNGIDLHVVLAGPLTGEAVILLHGFPEFWFGWIRQIEALAEQGYRVIAPDQRGYNLSSVPGRVEDYKLDMLTADMLGLMDHFGYQQVFLVGHDWGAAVAWNLAMCYPERIRKLAILNVPHTAVMLRFLTHSPRQMLKSWYIAFFQIPGLADWLLGLGNYAGVLRMLKISALPTTFSADELEEYRQAYIHSRGLTGMINWYRALARFRPTAPQSIRLRMPVLILWGKQDIALSAEMADASLKFCDQGKLVFFEHASHWLQHDEAPAVNQQLREFFG